MMGHSITRVVVRVGSVLFFLALTVGIVSGCFLDELNSDESSSATGDAGEIVTLTGSVMAASGESGGTSALIRTEAGFAVTTAPVEATPVQIFTVEGDYLGETETDEGGAFTLEADLEDLKGADDTDTQWSEAIIVVAPDLGLENLLEMDVEEGITEEIATGETNPETTFAAQSLVADIADFSGWGFPYSEHFTGRNIACLDLVHERLWDSVDAEDMASIGGRIALMNEVLQGFMAAGGRTEAFYLPAYSDLMRAMMDGSITGRAGRWEAIVEKAGEGDPELDTEAALALYENGAAGDFAGVRSVLNGVTADATLSALVRALTTTTGSDADFCDIVTGETNAGSGEETATALIGMVTSAENASALDTTFGTEAGRVTLLGLMDNCAVDGTCAEVSANRTAFYGYFNAFGGDYADIYVPGAGFADPAVFDVIHTATTGCTGSDRDEFIVCGKAMQGIVSAGGIAAFLGPDGFSPNRDSLTAWAGYWSGQDDFTPANTSPEFYQEAFTALHTTFDGAVGHSFSQCLNQAGGSATSCYTQAGVQHYDSFTNYVSSGGSLCGNGTCNSGETSATCPADCPVAPVCGDSTCSGGETSSTCPADCPVAAFCGDSVCNQSQGESNANCPADCLPPLPPQWTQVVANGFGQVENKGVIKMLAAGSTLFAGTVRTTGIAQLYKTTDATTWTQVTNFTPALSGSTTAFLSMEYKADTGNIYVGTMNMNAVGLLYESTNAGASFSRINMTGLGFGEGGNWQVKGITLYGTKLYFSTMNNAGVQLWRSNVTPPYAWSKVLDFNDDDNDVISDNDVKLPTGMNVFAGKLYLAVEDPVGAQVYNSVTGDQNTWAKNTGVGDGFGTANNKRITSMQTYGSYLYAGTDNGVAGAQLWRTLDGVTWTQTVNNGAGSVANMQFRGLTIGPNASLWMTTKNAFGAMVLRSTDGFNFQAMNTNGFGDANNISGTPDLEMFGGFMFWGGENLVTGVQIWKVMP